MKKIERATGSFYYYAWAADITIAVAINNLAAAQSKGNGESIKVLVYLLNYAAIYSNAKFYYYSNGILLHIYSNGFYLSLLKHKAVLEDITSFPIVV